MNALATIPDTNDAVSIKPRRIPAKISQIVDWLVTGACKNQQAACERANLDPSYVSRELRKVHVRVFAERRARETIANGTMRASARVLELLDASSEHVSFEASKHVLAIAGIKPTADAQVSVNIDIKAGYVIDLTDSAKSVTDTQLTRGPVIDHE
jgi:hypothetical protein